MKIKEEFIGHVYEENIENTKNSKHFYIQSEDPDHHWNFLNVKDQVVLDLGCGIHLKQPEWQTTPEYFTKKGALKVIGVDGNQDDINYLKLENPNNVFYCDFIDSSEKLISYINDNKVTSLKLDIEGFESLFIDSKNDFPTLKYVAIETHSRDLLNSSIKKLVNLNFKIDTICTFYPEAHHMCNLIYAYR
jgi:hypothetical protein